MSSATELVAERELQLREAIRDVVERTRDGDEDERQFWWGSIQGLIRSERDRQILREETAPEQVELDLHLTGEGVDGHRTNASRLGAFIQRISEATKAMAKQASGAQRYSENLLVEGFAPGSVRVVLRAPDAKADPREVLAETETETADSRALRRVAQILALASADEPAPDGSDPLTGAIEGLPLQARDSLRSAAQDFLRAGWELEGSVRQRRQPEEHLTVTRRGAQHLRSTLSVKVPKPRRFPIVGVLDGFRRSTGVAYIKADDAMHPFAVAVTDAELFHRVAEMAVDESLPVQATVDEWQRTHADGSPGRVSRRMVDIVPIGVQGELNVQD